MDRAQALTDTFMNDLPAHTQGEAQFRSVLEEVAGHVLTIEKNTAAFCAARPFARLAEPDRVIGFRVTWEDDTGQVQINRGWRVQGSNAIGPYKGGLRFHPSVNADVLKALAFEQCFKNALTGLPLGGAKGGSDFDPTGCSPNEVMRFCQAFMRQLAPHIGPDKDVPAGDINVGAREIGWLFGAWRANAHSYGGALTGKGLSYGGSQVRVEATGYGLIYFVQAMLAHTGDDLSGKRVAISGKGNVATHAALKAVDQGATVISLSDTSGTLYAPDGLTAETIAWVQDRKAAGEDIASPRGQKGLEFREGTLPWALEADIALPCATQNELDESAAQGLVDQGLTLLAEGANMPLTPEASRVIADSQIPHAPGKASNAGGVAVSGLEMSQNSQRQSMTAQQVDDQLRAIMADIHERIVAEGQGGAVNYARGANVAAYRRLAQAITAQGIV